MGERFDVELLKLFRQDPEQGWKQFIDKYADVIWSYLQDLGFDYDQAMDRFSYICEKLCEKDFRRLKTIRYAGQMGDLTPWVREVVKHLCINWTQSVKGRRRLLKTITRLPEREQHIFELYFWQGLLPSEIYEELRSGQQPDIGLVEVFEALERIFAQLSPGKLWRLVSNQARTRRTVSLDARVERSEGDFEPVAPGANPEEALIQKEAEERRARALDGLLPRERLMVQFRYEDGMTVAEITEMLHLREQEVKGLLKTALAKLRRALK